MITIKGVAGDSKYFAKDDYYARENKGGWIFDKKNIKSMGIDANKILQEKVFDTLIEKGIGSKTMVGQDLTFSAPKSLSLLYALGNQEQQKIALNAHLTAVKKTLELIRDDQIITRETKDGQTVFVKGTTMSAVVFDHVTSREKDPQLHSHAIILNQTTRATDGEKRAIDFKATLKGTDRKKLDVLYKSEISHELIKAGINIEWDKDGKNFSIKGITPEQEEAFSKRRSEIKEYISEHNLDMNNDKDRQAAALLTRNSKEKINLAELLKEWKQRAEKKGWDISKSIDANRLDKETINRITKKDFELRAESKVALQVLSDMSGTFTKTDFLAKAAELSHQAGRVLNLKESIAYMNFLKKREGQIKKVGIVEGKNVMVTKEFLEAEKNILSNLKNRDEEGPLVSPEEFEKDLPAFKQRFIKENGAWLSDEQEKAFKNIFTTDRVFSGIQGYAGVGKSFMLKAANEYGKEKGIVIVGAASTGQAAKVLQESSGIKSRTIHSRISSSKDGFSKRWVVVLDEAGMLDAKIMNDAFKEILESKARLVLLGDTNQLQPVGSGKPFELMQEKGLQVSTITNIRRQTDPETREALRSYASGDSTKIKQLIEERGLINQISDQEELINQAIEKYKEYVAKDSVKDVLLMAQTNKTVSKINQIVRDDLKKSGKLQDGINILVDNNRVNKYIARDKLKDGYRKKIDSHDVALKEKILTFKIGEEKKEVKEFSKGDRIVFLKNDRKIGVQNGNVGTIEKINDKKMSVKIDGGRSVSFLIDPDASSHGDQSLKYYNNFDHGYAITVHKSQGATVKNAVYIDEGIGNRNSIYVGLTRAKQETHIFTRDQSKLYEKFDEKQQKMSVSEIVEQKRKENITLKIKNINPKIQLLKKKSERSMLKAEEKSEWDVNQEQQDIFEERMLKAEEKSEKELAKLKEKDDILFMKSIAQLDEVSNQPMERTMQSTETEESIQTIMERLRTRNRMKPVVTYFHDQPTKWQLQGPKNELGILNTTSGRGGWRQPESFKSKSLYIGQWSLGGRDVKVRGNKVSINRSERGIDGKLVKSKTEMTVRKGLFTDKISGTTIKKSGNKLIVTEFEGKQKGNWTKTERSQTTVINIKETIQKIEEKMAEAPTNKALKRYKKIEKLLKNMQKRQSIKSWEKIKSIEQTMQREKDRETLKSQSLNNQRDWGKDRDSDKTERGMTR